jgi:hypothetical protein
MGSRTLELDFPDEASARACLREVVVYLGIACLLSETQITVHVDKSREPGVRRVVAAHGGTVRAR